MCGIFAIYNYQGDVDAKSGYFPKPRILPLLGGHHSTIFVDNAVLCMTLGLGIVVPTGAVLWSLAITLWRTSAWPSSASLSRGTLPQTTQLQHIQV
ncbi:hypothetical protein BC937DRAFT_89637 [Endogone sp. FLAS-F59071]|nr:hypothetical protein BC937DRAFT_89637 [Endogone sp. FLAS-F59071]|eukprot:RUS22337.1 hypothetical protein BC937DRAFT_89637 [Endogone sp. FLAS-F59071]